MTHPSSPAYPVIIPDLSTCQDFGLTKRELFAAMAMQGLMRYMREIDVRMVANDAVMSADALIVELNKRKSNYLPLTDDEIEDHLNPISTCYDFDCGFKAGVKFAEKHHNITVQLKD